MHIKQFLNAHFLQNITAKMKSGHIYIFAFSLDAKTKKSCEGAH